MLRVQSPRNAIFGSSTSVLMKPPKLTPSSVRTYRQCAVRGLQKKNPCHVQGCTFQIIAAETRLLCLVSPRQSKLPNAPSALLRRIVAVNDLTWSGKASMEMIFPVALRYALRRRAQRLLPHQNRAAFLHASMKALRLWGSNVPNNTATPEHQPCVVRMSAPDSVERLRTRPKPISPPERSVQSFCYCARSKIRKTLSTKRYAGFHFGRGDDKSSMSSLCKVTEKF